MRDTTLKCDLAIVGGGIAGPALAAAMADDGYRIALIERNAGPLDTARGDHLQPITCEALAHWGVLDMMFERGAERRLGARWQMPNGQPVLDARVDDLPLPYPYFVYLHHELISEVLIERAAQNPDFTLLRPGTARIVRDGVAPGRHGIVVACDGAHTQVEARCIALADGRSSRTRKTLDIETRVHNYENPLLVLFAARTFADPRNDVHVYLTSRGVVSVVPRTGDEWKIGFPLPRAELDEWTNLSAAELGRRLSAIVPALGEIRPRVAGVYPVAMVNASRWTDGNCVWLGDACHALHPGRSQGMNVALRSVALLAQRLRDGDLTNHVAELLAEFEASCKPAIDERLEENHARGLDMDRIDESVAERMLAGLTAVAASPEKTRNYCMNAAGY